MQRFKIVKNNLPSFSGSSTSASITGATGEQLQLKNNYYVYSSEIGNSTVNDNNVRDFLDDERNSELAIDFVSHLQSNTNTNEFKDIFYDNKKLASVFNSYYLSRGLSQNNLKIKEQTQGTTAVTVSISTFDKDNNRINVNETFLNAISKELNYFVPVYIQQDRKLLEDGNYAQYFKDCNNNTYDYKRYTFTNNISNNVVYGNSAYVNSIKTIDNLGYSQLQENLSGNYSVGNLESISLNFQTFSQFEKHFDFKPPIITNSFPGFFISQSVITLSNGGAFHVFGYNNYYNPYNTTIGFSAQFKTNSLKFYDKSFSPTTVPVTIELSRPSIGNSYFTVKAESYSTATLLSDFYFKNTNSDSIQIHIQDNYKDITIPLQVTSNLQPEESIVLSMRSGETIISYMILRGEDIIPVNNYSKDPTLLIENERRNKLMLRCFVDYNFDDNESAFYHNNNIKVIDSTVDAGKVSMPTINESLINKVANTLRISNDDIKNLYVYGSELYGTNHSQSDFDLIAVVNSNIPHQNIVTDEFNIQVYSEQQFKTDLKLNNFPAIEMKFVPSWAVLKQSFELDVTIKKSLIKDHGIHSALENLNEAKASASNLGLKYLVKKRLFHAYRKLLFVEQLLKFGEINDFNAADSFRGELTLLNINSKEDINTNLQQKFNKKINEIKVN